MISDFITHVTGIWNALLAENFVFSFKNTRDIVVYAKLEEIYRHLPFQVRQIMTEIENKLDIEIANKSAEIDKICYKGKSID